MLAFMHEAEPYGHLRLKDRDIAPDILARMVGTSLKIVRRLLAELETSGVFSRTDQGGLYFAFVTQLRSHLEHECIELG
jgi:hypothetical protein